MAPILAPYRFCLCHSSSVSHSYNSRGRTFLLMETTSMERRKGPWTDAEDIRLRVYVSTHGENNWNSVAFNSGLRRCRSSCSLRWFNYLKPRFRQDNIITDEEMLRILLLHYQLGSRWSKIAQLLPERSDKKMMNFWYTRVIREAKELNCEAGSMEFLRLMAKRLVGRIKAEGKRVDPSLICPIAYNKLIKLLPVWPQRWRLLPRLPMP